MTLFPEQQTAVDLITKWLRDKPTNEFKLGGYAGTGKTTIIKSILAAITWEDDADTTYKSPCNAPAVAAFTGKAVSVLKRKGVTDATTLHSLLYHPMMVNRKMEFQLRDELKCDFLIIDEASMMSRQLYQDIMSFDIPVLWVGDPGQLEPVGDDVGLMAKPDYVLETIHRQGEGSAILKFAEQMRFGARPKAFDLNISYECKVEPYTGVLNFECDQVICGYNKTRAAVNLKIRKMLGHSSEPLVVGERLVCLKNDANRGLFNGMLLTCKAITSRNANVWILDCEDELGSPRTGLHVWIPQLAQPKTIDAYEFKQILWRAKDPDLVLLDYGYCLTCHKSQGSEWDTVAVIEEIWEDKWDAKRWRYTAATRAAKKLIYLYR